MPFFQKHPRGISLKVFVQPRSSKNEIAGLHGDAVKIRLKAPPVDGAANALCIQYLSKCLKVPKSSLQILSGHTGRTKHILVIFPMDENPNVEIARLEATIESLTARKKTA